MNRADRARDLFLGGANCAQAVIGAYCGECGLDFRTAMRLASGFGAGIGRLREVCGAVSAMVMVADLLCGPEDPSDKRAKDDHYAFVRRLTEAFEREVGSLICRRLLGLPGDGRCGTESDDRTAEYYRRRPCAELVTLAVTILEEHLNSAGKV